MNRGHLVLRSLQHNCALHLACALGIAIATAVITGALVIGDSVRDSLRQLTEERLGLIEQVLIVPDSLTDKTAEQFRRRVQLAEPTRQVTSAWILPQVTVAQYPSGSPSIRQSTGVLCMAPADSFWSFDVVGVEPTRLPRGRQVVVNRRLANELGIDVGSRLLVRFPKLHAAPAETPFGRRDADITTIVDLEVVDILPDRGLGRFALSPSQVPPKLLYLDPATIQQALTRPGQYNAIFVAGRQSDPGGSLTETDLDDALQLGLDDFGIFIEKIAGRFQPPDHNNDRNGEGGKPAEVTAWEYWNVSSRHLLIREPFHEAIGAAIAELTNDRNAAQEVFTYLANSMVRLDTDGLERGERAGRAVPYSMVSALDVDHVLGPYSDTELPGGRLRDSEIILNSWLATELKVGPGDFIELRYFRPETAVGTAVEDRMKLKVVGITPIVRPTTPFRRNQGPIFKEPPTRANDPSLTPRVDGVTDRQSIEDWDPPFPFESRRILPADDDFWDYFRTTPKAFVSLTTGQKVWGSRFGSLTSFRVPIEVIPTEEALRTSLTDALRARQRELGFAFTPIKEEGLRASIGTTPFEYLFLGFSLFLLISALSMVALLVGLSLQSRRTQMGVLIAVGWSARQVSSLFRLEALVVTTLGTLLGLGLGIAYAAVMTYGLRTWWLAATVAPVVQLSFHARTLGIGLFVSLVTCFLVAWIHLRGQVSREPRQLISGSVNATSSLAQPAFRRWGFRFIPLLLIISAILLSWLGSGMRGEAQAGTFFGAGAMTLAAGILVCWSMLHLGAPGKSTGALRTLAQLSRRSATRHATRSILVVALVAAAVFLLIAVSAFRQAPTEEGTGGFEWIAETDVPVFDDLSDPGLQHTMFHHNDPDAVQTAPGAIVSFMLRNGDDASCRNLFQISRPRLLGVDAMAAKQLSHRFRFAAAEGDDAWTALRSHADARGIPVILDQNTARYGLKLFGGAGQQFELNYDDQPIRFRVVGLLSNSILQGQLLISTENLNDAFPGIVGRQYFLIDVSDEQDKDSAAIAAQLQSDFGDQGMSVQSAELVLHDLLAIQNTYLTTFQTLGGLGLLLGTIGLAIVEVRNILERRKELALLGAVGFAPGTIRRLVTMEHFGLLALGMLVGIAAALVTLIPYLGTGQLDSPRGHLLALLTLIVAMGWAASYGASLVIAFDRPQATLRNY